MRKLYLDIDGVLLTKRNVRAAEGALELIDYVLSNFDCYWLTTYCRTNDTKEVLCYLAEYFSNDVVDRLKIVNPAVWDTLKTEGIDFGSNFYWLDDCLFEAERRELEYYQCLGSRGGLQNLFSSVFPRESSSAKRELRKNKKESAII